MVALNTTEVMDIIPNRYPILYIDYVDEIEPDQSLVGLLIYIHTYTHREHKAIFVS